MADRYWVGGGSSANWNATGPTNWSATSGGSNDASVPTSSDDVFFDGNSPNSTISASQTVKSIDFTGYINTLTHNASVAMGVGGTGNNLLKFSPGMTYSRASLTTSSILINPTSGICEVTTNGKTLGNITINTSTGLIRLMDDLQSTGTVSLFNNTLDLNGNNLKSTSLVTSTTNRSALADGTTIAHLQVTTAYSIQGGSGSSSENNQQRAQSFTAVADTILGVGIRLQINGTPTDDLIVEITSTLDGSPLASVTRNSSDLSTVVINHFKFNTPLVVSPSSTYYIRIRRSGSRDTTNSWSLVGSTAGNYAGGTALTRSNLTWTQNTGVDFVFVIFEKGTGANTIELTGSGNVLNFQNSALVTTFLGTSTIKLTNNSSSSKSFVGASKEFHNLWNATQGTGTVTLLGNNTFNLLKLDTGRVTLFESGSTQIINDLEANQSTLQSTVSGNAFILSKALGSVILSRGALKDSTATGGATFTAKNTTNNGGNTGWNFIETVLNLTTVPTTVTNTNTTTTVIQSQTTTPASLINLQTNQSAIINENTVLTNVTNI